MLLKGEQCEHEGWLRVTVIDGAKWKGILLKYLFLWYDEVSNNK